MNGEKPKPKTWKEIKETAVINIDQMEMQLKIEKSILVTANAELLAK